MSPDTGQCTSGVERTGVCDYCYSIDDLIAVTTIVNGIEKKEWVCPSCEPEAREHEKPPLRADGGTVEDQSDHPDLLRCLDCGSRVVVHKKRSGSYILSCGCEWSRPTDEPEMGIWARGDSEHWENSEFSEGQND